MYKYLYCDVCMYVHTQGRAYKFRDTFLISRREIWQCYYLECKVTQQDSAHMESSDKLRSVFVEQQLVRSLCVVSFVET
jgi:hypothetical protein